MKNKPISEGYKVLSLCTNGYCYTFEMVSCIEKASVPLVPGLSHTSSIIVQMCSALPHTTKGYNVYMDNFVSNIPLFEHLRAPGTSALS